MGNQNLELSPTLDLTALQRFDLRSHVQKSMLSQTGMGRNFVECSAQEVDPSDASARAMVFIYIPQPKNANETTMTEQDRASLKKLLTSKTANIKEVNTPEGGQLILISYYPGSSAKKLPDDVLQAIGRYENMSIKLTSPLSTSASVSPIPISRPTPTHTDVRALQAQANLAMSTSGVILNPAGDEGYEEVREKDLIIEDAPEDPEEVAARIRRVGYLPAAISKLVAFTPITDADTLRLEMEPTFSLKAQEDIRKQLDRKAHSLGFLMRLDEINMVYLISRIPTPPPGLAK